MARKTKKPPDPEKLRELSALMQQVEVQISAKMECVICETFEWHADYTEEELARHMYDQGWRVGTSEKFCVTGSMCKTCFNTPDAERGEDYP